MAPGPRCGHADHHSSCPCDVVLRDVVTDIRHTPFEWHEQMVARAAIEVSDDPERFWDMVVSLVRAEQAKMHRTRLGLPAVINGYGDGRKLLRAYLTDGGWTSELYEDDRACAIRLGPEFVWETVLGLWTTHNTRGRARLNVWDRLDWENFEQCVIERTPVDRALARELGISRTTIETMYAMHGVRLKSPERALEAS
jgi:hypothetical protein